MRKVEMTELRVVEAGADTSAIGSVLAGIQSFLAKWTDSDKDGTYNYGTLGILRYTLKTGTLYLSFSSVPVLRLFAIEDITLFSLKDILGNLFSGLKTA